MHGRRLPAVPSWQRDGPGWRGRGRSPAPRFIGQGSGEAGSWLVTAALPGQKLSPAGGWRSPDVAGFSSW